MTWQHVISVTWPAALIIGAAVAAMLAIEYSNKPLECPQCHAEICEANYAKDSNLCIDCQIEDEYQARMSWKR